MYIRSFYLPSNVLSNADCIRENATDAYLR